MSDLIKKLEAIPFDPDGLWQHGINAAIKVVQQHQAEQPAQGDVELVDINDDTPVGDAYAKGYADGYKAKALAVMQSATVVDEPDTLIMACEEVLRLMALWKRHYGYSNNCDNACESLRVEMRKHLSAPKQQPTPQPASVVDKYRPHPNTTLEVRIDTALHRLNLNRPDIAALKDGETIVRNISDDRWLAALLVDIKAYLTQSMKPRSLHKCAMSLQGNPRIKLGSDLRVIAKAVLDAANVPYEE